MRRCEIDALAFRRAGRPLTPNARGQLPGAAVYLRWQALTGRALIHAGGKYATATGHRQLYCDRPDRNATCCPRAGGNGCSILQWQRDACSLATGWKLRLISAPRATPKSVRPDSDQKTAHANVQRIPIEASMGACHARVRGLPANRRATCSQCLFP